MQNGRLKNYDLKDLCFKDYPQPGIMQIAVWLQRKEFKKLYPGCIVTVVRFHDYVRIIASEPDVSEVNSFMLLYADFVGTALLRKAVRELKDYFRHRYPDCQIIVKHTELGANVVALKKNL